MVASGHRSSDGHFNRFVFGYVAESFAASSAVRRVFTSAVQQSLDLYKLTR